MKKLLLFFITAIGMQIGVSQELNEPYDFSAVTENGKLKGVPYEEKVRRLQIPEDVLSRLSTEALVENCINYRLFYVIKAFNNIQEGFEQVLGDFNGFTELCNRNTAGDVLVNKYISIDPLGYDKYWSDLEKGYFLDRLFRIEMLLAQKDIMDNVSNANRKRLLDDCRNKITAKRSGDIYSSFNVQFVYLVITGVIRSSSEQWNTMPAINQKMLEEFLNTGIITSKETMELIESIRL